MGEFALVLGERLDLPLSDELAQGLLGGFAQSLLGVDPAASAGHHLDRDGQAARAQVLAQVGDGLVVAAGDDDGGVDGAHGLTDQLGDLGGVLSPGLLTDVGVGAALARVSALAGVDAAGPVEVLEVLALVRGLQDRGARGMVGVGVHLGVDPVQGHEDVGQAAPSVDGQGEGVGYGEEGGPVLAGRFGERVGAQEPTLGGVQGLAVVAVGTGFAFADGLLQDVEGGLVGAQGREFLAQVAPAQFDLLVGVGGVPTGVQVDRGHRGVAFVQGSEKGKIHGLRSAFTPAPPTSFSGSACRRS